jgi:hypothetical protein
MKNLPIEHLQSILTSEEEKRKEIKQKKNYIINV